MITIVAGSRRAPRQTVFAALAKLPWTPTLVLCGCAAGADTWGHQWAGEHRVPVQHVPANWRRFGRAAGPIRNTELVARADALVLVWDGHSAGSADVLAKARRAGLRVHEHRFDPEQQAPAVGPHRNQPHSRPS